MEIKKQCSQVVNKKRCQGIYRPALMREDWQECPDCGRTGRVATGKCGKCAGVGWLYVNNHPKPKQKDQTVQPELFQNLKTGPRSNHRKG
jgi:DnaJ-class molecular chaperone